MAVQSDQTKTGVVTTIVVVGSFAMISISAMITAMVRAEHAELDRERPTNADLETVARLEEQQLARLSEPPRWVAEPGGKVSIPIERAMQLVLEQYRTDPASASPPPPPGMQMGPAAGAAPAPPGSPNVATPGSPQPATPSGSPAVPGPAAPDPSATPRVVPPPAAPGPAATPDVGSRRP